MNLTVCQDPGDVARRAADAFVEAVAAAGDRPAVCLAGGSTPQATHHLLTTPEYADRVDWPRVHVFFGDERRVPLDDPRSNYRAACESLLDHVPVTAANVHPLTDADQYEGLLRAFFGDAVRVRHPLPGDGRRRPHGLVVSRARCRCSSRNGG